LMVINDLTHLMQIQFVLFFQSEFAFQL
jgi:hypothetical protein